MSHFRTGEGASEEGAGAIGAEQTRQPIRQARADTLSSRNKRCIVCPAPALAREQPDRNVACAARGWRWGKRGQFH
ncbi:MAG: hypothetical protein ACR2OG_07695 [Gemmatimonadaceae bacterium]